MQHKVSGIRYLLNRLLEYQFSNEKEKEEQNVIQTVLHSNRYEDNMIKSVQPKVKKQNPKMSGIVRNQKDKENKKWATFTSRKKVHHTTKLFEKPRPRCGVLNRNTGTKITQNTITVVYTIFGARTAPLFTLDKQEDSFK